MDKPLRAHVLFLESQIQELNESLTTHEQFTVDRDEIVRYLDLLTRSLDYYREALDLERAFRRSNPAPIQNPAKRANPAKPANSAKSA